MDDQQKTNTSLPATPNVSNPNPQQVSVSQPRPIQAPAGIPIKEPDVSNLSPQPPKEIQPLRSSIRTMGAVSTAPQAPRPPQAIPSSPRIPTPAPVNPVQAPKPPVFVPPRPVAMQSTPTQGIHRAEAVRPLAPSSVSIPPSSSKSSNKWLFIGALIVILAGILLWFFAIRNSNSENEATPSPTQGASSLPSSTPALDGFQNLFPTQGTLRYSTVTNPSSAFAELNADINSQNIAQGKLRSYSLVGGVDQIRKTFGEFATEFRLNIPVDVVTKVQGDDFSVSLFRVSETKVSRGFAVKVTDTQMIQSSLATWESGMTESLKDFFVITPSQAVSAEYLTGLYRDTNIRYRNFRDAFNSIDYAVVTLPDNSVYLLFTGSRDHMFYMIDKILGVIPGK